MGSNPYAAWIGTASPPISLYVGLKLVILVFDIISSCCAWLSGSCLCMGQTRPLFSCMTSANLVTVTWHSKSSTQVTGQSTHKLGAQPLDLQAADSLILPWGAMCTCAAAVTSVQGSAPMPLQCDVSIGNCWPSSLNRKARGISYPCH